MHDAALRQAPHSQLATAAVATGAYDALRAAGLAADFAAGDGASGGELAALYAAGALERDAAFDLICLRARADAAGAEEAFGARVRAARFRAPPGGAKVFASATGTAAYAQGGGDEACTLLAPSAAAGAFASTWSERLRAMHSAGARVFVCFGPRHPLAAALGEALPDVTDVCIHTTHTFIYI